MAQNRSTAVMQRRRVAPDSLDYFPTPPFATRALCEFLASLGHDLPAQAVWEPACGELHMARPLGEYFSSVRASDVHDYGGHELADFTLCRDKGCCDWVISNPPFRLAQPFIEAAIRAARVGTAMLVRSAFLEGQTRFDEIYRDWPPDFVLQFSERVVMLEGRLVRSGGPDPFAQNPGASARSATAYSLLVWLAEGSGDTRLRWIAPCRARLERPGDYPEYAPAPGEPAAAPLLLEAAA